MRNSPIKTAFNGGEVIQKCLLLAVGLGGAAWIAISVAGWFSHTLHSTAALFPH